jgi:hypothetical protein
VQPAALAVPVKHNKQHAADPHRAGALPCHLQCGEVAAPAVRQQQQRHASAAASASAQQAQQQMQQESAVWTVLLSEPDDVWLLYQQPEWMASLAR